MHCMGDVQRYARVRQNGRRNGALIHIRQRKLAWGGGLIPVCGEGNVIDQGGESQGDVVGTVDRPPAEARAYQVWKRAQVRRIGTRAGGVVLARRQNYIAPRR